VELGSKTHILRVWQPFTTQPSWQKTIFLRIQAVGIAMAAATFRCMQATAKTAMRRVLGIRGGQGETLVPPTAVAGGDEGFVFEFEASDNNNGG
jgi:hypothetical protein